MIEKGFPKDCRLRCQKDILKVRQIGKRERQGFLTFCYLPKKQQKARLAFSLSRKVGKANIRNRIKRLFREAFRYSSQKDSSVDILVMVTPKIRGHLPLENIEDLLVSDYKYLLGQVGRKVKN